MITTSLVEISVEAKRYKRRVFSVKGLDWIGVAFLQVRIKTKMQNKFHLQN